MWASSSAQRPEDAGRAGGGGISRIRSESVCRALALRPLDVHSIPGPVLTRCLSRGPVPVQSALQDALDSLEPRLRQLQSRHFTREDHGETSCCPGLDEIVFLPCWERCVDLDAQFGPATAHLHLRPPAHRDAATTGAQPMLRNLPDAARSAGAPPSTDESPGGLSICTTQRRAAAHVTPHCPCPAMIG